MYTFLQQTKKGDQMIQIIRVLVISAFIISYTAAHLHPHEHTEIKKEIKFETPKKNWDEMYHIPGSEAIHLSANIRIKSYLSEAHLSIDSWATVL